MRTAYDAVGAASRMLRVAVAVGLGVVLLSGVARAQDRPITDRSLHLAPYVVMATGQAADVLVTNRKFQQGCTEANRAVFGGDARPSMGRIVATKALVTLPAVLTTVLLQKSGHQKAANWMGVIVGAWGFGAAGYNLTVQCGH